MRRILAFRSRLPAARPPSSRRTSRQAVLPVANGLGPGNGAGIGTGAGTEGQARRATPAAARGQTRKPWDDGFDALALPQDADEARMGATSSAGGQDRAAPSDDLLSRPRAH